MVAKTHVMRTIDMRCTRQKRPAPTIASVYSATMTPRLLLRLSTGLLVVFLIGHGLGSLASATRDASEASVFAAMQSYRFPIMGVTRSHWDFYQGLNHYLSAALVALIAVHLVTLRLADRSPADARALTTVLAVSQVLFSVLSWTYFFPAPAVMTTLSAVCLAYAAARLR